jgi:DNA-binding MarR family transcriptional regulator
MAHDVETTAAAGVLQEHLTSPALLLALLGHDAMRRLRDAHTANGLKPRQFQILGLLEERGPMGQSELRHTAGVDPSILVTLLNPLETARLVSRRRDRVDRRRHVVTLTPAGARRLAAAGRAQREAEQALLAGLDPEQREQLRGLLVALRDSLAPTAGGACADAEPDPCESREVA